MRHSFSALLLCLSVSLTGCAKEETPATDANEAMAKEAPAAMSKKDDVMKPVNKPNAVATAVGQLSAEDKARLENTIASSFGKGSFKDDSGVSYSFTLQGDVLADKSGYGNFRFYSFQDDGKLDIKGEMACVSIDSEERRIWLAAKITENTSTEQKYREGQYAPGGYVQFRARPNSMDGKTPAAIEIPSYVDQKTAEAFCSKQAWSDDVLNELGKNDLIAAIP